MEPTIYKPSIYKGAGIYKNGAGSNVPEETPLIFYTIGNAEEDGKDKPIKGGLSNRAFDETTFYKTTENGINFFNIYGGENWYYVYWKDILDTYPVDGDTYYLELTYKNTNVTTPNYKTSLFSFLGRVFEIGMENGTTTLSIGCSYNGGSVSVIYKNSGWSVISGLGPYDYKVKNISLQQDRIYKVYGIAKYLSNGYAEVSYYISGPSITDECIMVLQFKRLTIGNEHDIAGTIVSNRKLTLGNIKIIKLK